MAKSAAALGDAEAVGAAMRAAREKQGLTQEQMALRLGVTQPCVAKWESGGSPRADQIRSVAREYKMRPDLLLPERAA